MRYRKRSRVSKALTDAGRAASFDDAEARLDAVQIDIVLGADQLRTPAGQAAALTAVATARKCFGRVSLVSSGDAPLLAPLPLGRTVLTAAQRLGATLANRPTAESSHTILIGASGRTPGWSLRCWWDRWLTGSRASDEDAIGDSRQALAGVFAAALAVRQVFACVLTGRNLLERDVTVSLWTPWQQVDLGLTGPECFDIPDKLWLLGLGHLGQAFVWNLCFLPSQDGRQAILQDDQFIGEENEATSLLVLPDGSNLGQRKTRLAAAWLEACGWNTELIERRHQGDIKLADGDPPYLLAGLDRLDPRLILAKHGFPVMLDAGVGHGPGDFEGIQLRTILNGQPPDGLWCVRQGTKPEQCSQRLLDMTAYRELEKHVGECGKVGFAEASVAVPFVGAATGALVVAQAIRLASLEQAPLLLQMELGSPEMVTLGGLTSALATNLGSIPLQL
jgi:hypothetical protein